MVDLPAKGGGRGDAGVRDGAVTPTVRESPRSCSPLPRRHPRASGKEGGCMLRTRVDVAANDDRHVILLGRHDCCCLVEEVWCLRARAMPNGARLARRQWIGDRDKRGSRHNGQSCQRVGQHATTMFGGWAQRGQQAERRLTPGQARHNRVQTAARGHGRSLRQTAAHVPASWSATRHVDKQASAGQKHLPSHFPWSTTEVK